MTELSFRLTGPFIPYVRMTRRGKFINSRAQAYLSNQDALRWQIMGQMSAANALPLPECTPISVMLDFRLHHLHTGDLDNHVKAILDAAQGIVFPNDCWVDSLLARRRLQLTPDKDNPTSSPDVCYFLVGARELFQFVVMET